MPSNLLFHRTAPVDALLVWTNTSDQNIRIPVWTFVNFSASSATASVYRTPPRDDGLSISDEYKLFGSVTIPANSTLRDEAQRTEGDLIPPGWHIFIEAGTADAINVSATGSDLNV